MATTDPYEDVVRDEFAESLRLPLVSNPHPRWYFITAVVVSELYKGARPSDDELRMVASFHEQYCDYWYTESFKTKMAERPFDVDGGANGRILIKRQDGGWGFRRRSWEHGPLFVPEWNAEPESLLQVLDRECTYGGKPSDRWGQWKADHPDLFPVAAS